MRPLSIKVKITLWYTGLIVFILCIILGSIIFSTDKILILQLQQELEDEVYDALEAIRYKDGALAVDDMKYFDDGIHISLYTKERRHIAGQVPAGFPDAVPFQSEQMQTIQTAAGNWLVYDAYATAKGPEPLWIRGVISLSSTYATRNQIVILCMILFPFLVLLAGSGGWLITKSAFQPVSLIRRTAAEIENSGDLSKRIQLTGSEDEIYNLAQTFDHMLDRLETSFNRERQFTADASHELRTPISVIMAYAEYGLSQQENREEMTGALQVIQQQAGKMNSLIASLLFLARADQQEEKLELEVVNLSEVAGMIAEEITVIAQAKHITVNAEIVPHIKILADQTSIMRLLLNLLQNAIRYGRENGWVQLRLWQTGDGVAGSIADNGIGIAPENISKIWDRFYQEDPARKRTEDSGAGLGLPIVKWIIEQHHGSIEVESHIGQGTVFRFFLPARARQAKDGQ